MAEQPFVDIPVKTSGIEESFTNIGKFSQETAGLMDKIRERSDELNNSQIQSFIRLRAELTQLSQKDYADLIAKMDEVKRKADEQAAAQKQAVAQQKESANSVMDWITQVPSNLMSKIPGAGIASGGLLALLLYGYAETGRIETEGRRMAQIFEASSSQAVNSLQGVSQEFEKLRAQTNMSNTQIRMTVDTLARIGVPAGEISRNFGDVGKNIASAAMAYDAFLERASGTTAKDFVTLIQRYNLDGKELIGTYGGLTSAARNAQVGTEIFMTSVFDATRTLKTYGVDILNVSGLLSTLIAQGKEAGTPLEATMTGFAGIAQGLSNLSQGWKATIGKDILQMRGMTDATAMGGLMFMETGAMRGGTADQGSVMRDTLGALDARLRTMTSGVPEEKLAERVYGILRFGLNFGPEASAMIRDLFTGGQLANIASGVSEISPRLAQALENERNKMTPWEQATKEIMLGLSHIAQGMFGLVTNLFGLLGSFFAYFIGWSQHPMGVGRLPEETTLMNAASAAMGASIKGMGANANMVWEGVKEIASGAKIAAKPMLEPMQAPLDAIIEYYKESSKRISNAPPVGTENLPFQSTDPYRQQLTPFDFEKEMEKANRERKKITDTPSGGKKIDGKLKTDQHTMNIEINMRDLINLLASHPEFANAVGGYA